MRPFTSVLLFIFCLAASLSLATRPTSLHPFAAAFPYADVNGNDQRGSDLGGVGSNGGDDGGVGGFFGPGGGFPIPGFGSGIPGGGFGAGYGGPKGGYSKGGVVRPTVVCKVQGPCYLKKLRCPAKCFSSFSRAGKGYGAGGGGGGCTIDCKDKCIASC